MGSARTSSKEFEQLKGSLGSVPKASQSSTSTMAQSFRNDNSMAGGGFGSAQMDSQSSGGAFQPMSQGMGSLSSTGPIQCSKKKEEPKEYTRAEKLQMMENQDPEALIEYMVDLQSENDGANASGSDSERIYRSILSGTMADASWIDLIAKKQGQYAQKALKHRNDYKQQGELSPHTQFGNSKYGLRHMGYSTLMSNLGWYNRERGGGIGERVAGAGSFLKSEYPELAVANEQMSDYGLTDYNRGLSADGKGQLNAFRMAQQEEGHQEAAASERPWNKKKHRFRRWLNK